jgi:hypothetical protein
MRWNLTIYFSRTFSWHGNARSESEMLPPSPNLLLFFPRSSPLLIGSAYCIAAAVASSHFPPLPSLPASVSRAAKAGRQRCGDGGQCGGSVSSTRAMEAAQWWHWRRRQRWRQSSRCPPAIVSRPVVALCPKKVSFTHSVGTGAGVTSCQYVVG